jgi:SAM-dependent methyltransferase
MILVNCRVCGSSNLELIIDFGDQPWGNDFLSKDKVGSEFKYPLRLHYCHACSTSQIDHTVNKNIMFSDHTYLSGTTKTLSGHFKDLATYVKRNFFPNKKELSILDIGSNDGTQLKHYKNLDFDVLGVESSKSIAESANNIGIPTLNDFYNLDIAKIINRKFSVINASGVFFHLEELHSVCEAIKFNLQNEGVFVVQFIYIGSILKNLAFDQIYHEHLLYYSLNNLNFLLNKYDLEIFDTNFSSIHGGSMISFVGHKGKHSISDRLQKYQKNEEDSKINDIDTYFDFAKKVEKLKEINLEFINKSLNEGKTIYGFGAPVKGNTLLNFFGVTNKQLNYLVEKNPLRNGLYSPGSHIEIIMEDDVLHEPNIYYVLAWNFKNEILANNVKRINNGVDFYFPIDPKVSFLI